MKKTFRRILIAATALLAVLLIAGAAGFFWLRGSLPQTDGTRVIAGLTGTVEIIRDRHGVPHIFADHTEDAYFALGLVHAQDRLWQMETNRRAGAGRLSEIIGERTLKIDRFVRTLGLYRLAEAQVAALEDDERRLLEAYVRGVNAYLEQRDGPLPPEFVVFGHEPEQWRPADSLVWAKIMALRLSGNWRTELLRQKLADILPPERIEELWPTDGPDAPITVTALSQRRSTALNRLWDALPEELGPLDASNAWALSGDRTATGKPILATDPHLGFSAPALWYLARIEAPGLSLRGATVPGVPLMILGHNGRIAWGMTTTGGDTEDLFLERLDPDDPSRYLTENGSQPFKLRTEKIAVSGGDDVELTVRETRHGPVISDISADAEAILEDGIVVALASPALRPDDKTARALFRINKARNWSAFLDAARLFHAPQQNLFYADTTGDIGMITPGRLPVRSYRNGLTPVAGDDPQSAWRGFVPFDALPKSHNPTSGLIVNANNRLVGDDYPYQVSLHWEPAYRAERILEVLKDAGKTTVADNAALQMDALSPAARHLMPLLLKTQASTDRAKKALDLLRGWDFRMSRDRPEPLIYAAWVRSLMSVLARDELGDLFGKYGRSRPRFIAAALTSKRHWCDDVKTNETESCEAMLSKALNKALDDVAQSQGDDLTAWRWGKAHKAANKHRLFTFIPILKRFTDLPIETDGGDHTVNRGQTAQQGKNPFSHVHGSGYRAVYDLANLDRSRFIIGTGQSGNPFSPHYGDLLELWRDGGHVALAGDRETQRANASATLVLKPE